MREKAISEYGYIYHKEPKTLSDKFVHTQVSKEQFDELKEYWESSEETYKIFTPKSRDCLQATSYVGIIQTKSLSIEILPKIFTEKNIEISNKELREKNRDDHRHIFIQVLKPLLDINEVQINEADLSTTKNKNIYEMFITLFVQNVDKLIHRGLKSEYIAKEDNQNFLKGKLKFNQHIKQNYIHKERFYVEFDEYLQDRVENRLLKSTIKLLLKKTKSYDNKRRLRQQLFVFDEVQESLNHSVDIAKIYTHRGMEHYKTPLHFAKLFLTHQSFTSLRGKDNVFALLFPMQTVFEKYMEFVLENSKDELGIDEVMVNGGKNEYLLSHGECMMARLQPDYLLKMKEEEKYIVTDAKWKQLTPKENETKDCESVNISSGDVYQIFSYLHYYKNIYPNSSEKAYLFVPKTDDAKEMTLLYFDNKKKIQIIPINLEEIIVNHQLNKDIFDSK